MVSRFLSYRPYQKNENVVLMLLPSGFAGERPSPPTSHWVPAHRTWAECWCSNRSLEAESCRGKGNHKQDSQFHVRTISWTATQTNICVEFVVEYHIIPVGKRWKHDFGTLVKLLNRNGWFHVQSDEPSLWVKRGLQWFPTHIHQGSPLILSHFNEMDLSI